MFSVFAVFDQKIHSKQDLTNIILPSIRQRQLQFLGHSCRHRGLEHLAINGKIEGKRSRGRQRITFIENLKSWAIGKGSNNDFIRVTENRFEWRNMIANVCVSDKIPDDDDGDDNEFYLQAPPQ
ncbi:endonuclease-reverse transcriptase [Plakobranchus ocellatus]|uniref:Endonuclease-reverse transcriptase n=1 Tax=Plakobranchus ocellatus TaxID=259542 RepID=A0AAV4ASP2_9GAST|nr:endonuclease-reverse transcriptase [Plakobranchus ocellatus]